jgi:anti-sigma factor RsiW
MAGTAMTERETMLQFIRKYDPEEAERLERLLARKDAVAAGNAYGERLTERQFSLVFDPLLRNAAERAAILEALGPDPLSVPALSARLDLDASRVFGHIKELLRRDLVRIAGYEDGNAGFRRKG